MELTKQVSPDNPKRRISIHTDAGVQHYAVVQVERTDVPNSYLLRIDSRDGAWLAAGTYDATIHGKQRVNGSLAIIDYDVLDDGILFVGVFSVDDGE